MAVYDNEGLLSYKDKNGDIQRLYPVTKMKCVEGINVVEEHINNTSNPHNVDLPQLGVDATAEELNHLVGVTSSISEQFTKLSGRLDEIIQDDVDVHANLEKRITDTVDTIRDEYKSAIEDNNTELGLSFDEKADKGQTLTVTLFASEWSDREAGGYYQYVEAQGVTANNTIFVAPATDSLNSYYAYAQSMVACTEQTENQITFVCMSKPSVPILVNIAIVDCAVE